MSATPSAGTNTEKPSMEQGAASEGDTSRDFVSIGSPRALTHYTANEQEYIFPYEFDLKVDPDQGYRALNIKLCSLSRPHMRSFHIAWLSFLVAFTCWFAIPPISIYIKETLSVSQEDVDKSNIAVVSVAIVTRVILGTLCDRYGPRVTFGGLLAVSALPIGLSGLIQGGTGLIVVRFFIGILGGAFVCCQFWTSLFFAKSIVGTALALAAGWGNVGGGLSYLLMPGIFQLFNDVAGLSTELSWRLSMVVPASLLLMMAGVIYLFGDDCPTGSYGQTKKLRPYPKKLEGSMHGSVHGSVHGGLHGGPHGNEEKREERQQDWEEKERAVVELERQHSLESREQKIKTDRTSARVPSPYEAFTSAATSHNTYILAVAYACSFGVELAVDNSLGAYFYEELKKPDCDPVTDPMACRIVADKIHAQFYASIFGLMNVFSRPLGGFFSDLANRRFGLKGRIWVLFSLILGEGLTLFAFALSKSIPTAIVSLIFFSFFCQASCGGVFGVVPYVRPDAVGAVSGIVGAGGNIGGMSWGFLLLFLGDRVKALVIMAALVVLFSFVCGGLRVKEEETSSIILERAEDDGEEDRAMLAVYAAQDPSVHKLRHQR